MTSRRDDLVTSLAGEWNRLGAELVLLAQSVADRLKINLTDLQCLAVLMSAGPMTAGQIAEAAGLTSGAITGVLDRLEKASLVQRESDPADRRRVVVRALPGDVLAARDPAVSAAFARLAAAAAEQYAGYSDRELQLVVDALSLAHPVVLEQVSLLRDQPLVRHELDAPLGGVRTGHLHVAFGLRMTLDCDPAMTELYRAHVEGTPPQIDVEGGRVSVKPRRYLFGWGHRSLRLTLTAAIPWDVEVAQGAMALTAHLALLPLRSFVIKGGASRIELEVGRPTGVVPISIQGGASKVTVRRPRGVPVEVTIKGGASRAVVDGHRLGPALGAAWATPGMSATADRYAVEIHGGASHISIESV